MSLCRRSLELAALLFVALALSACSSLYRLNGSGGNLQDFWQGRIAVKDLSDTSRSFSAGFELNGNMQAGTFILLSSIGTTIAKMQWITGKAELFSGGKSVQFESLQAMSEKALEARIPMNAVFAWLKGGNFSADGWLVLDEPNSSSVSSSVSSSRRLHAKNTGSKPEVEFTILLDQ